MSATASSSPSSAVTETAVDAASPRAATLTAVDDLGRLSQLGYRGTRIPRHRAVRWLDRGAVRLAQSVGLALVAWLGLLAVATPIATAWGEVLHGAVAHALPGVQFVTSAGTALFPSVPEPRLDAGAPTPAQWLNVTSLAVLVLLGTLLVPRRFLPGIYIARFIALVQLSASCYFLLTPAEYPYAGGAHATTMLHCGWASMLLAPWILALCYYPLDFGWRRRIGLTLAIEAYFLVATPLIASIEAIVIQRGSLLVHPLVYLVFGPPLFVFWFVCFYGWGMSWRDRTGERA